MKKPVMSKVTLYIMGMQEKIFTNVLYSFLSFFFSFFWLGTLKIPQHNKLCMRFYISMYIFSSKYKLYALLTYKCFVALLFSLWQYFLTRHSTLCLYLIFPLSFYFFWQNSQIPFKVCVHMFCICVFSASSLLFFSPQTCMKLSYLLIMQ